MESLYRKISVVDKATSEKKKILSVYTVYTGCLQSMILPRGADTDSVADKKLSAVSRNNCAFLHSPNI